MCAACLAALDPKADLDKFLAVSAPSKPNSARLPVVTRSKSS